MEYHFINDITHTSPNDDLLLQIPYKSYVKTCHYELEITHRCPGPIEVVEAEEPHRLKALYTDVWAELFMKQLEKFAKMQLFYILYHHNILKLNDLHQNKLAWTHAVIFCQTNCI